MKYLILILCLALTASAYADDVMFYPAPVGTGSKMLIKQNDNGACAIWWLGTKYRGGCATWAQWPTDWFDIANNFVNGTDEQRTANYKSFGCTPGPEDCSQKLTPDVIALFTQMFNDTKPVTPPPVIYKVKANGAALTRPYYKANATMTGYGAKLGDVAVGTACDGTKRLGTSLYYWVAAGGYALCALVP